MRSRAILLGLGSVLLISCATTPAPSWPWISDDGKTIVPVCRAADGNCTEADVITNLSLASHFCRKVQNHYESGGFSSNEAKMTIATIGTLSGAVFAPLGKGSATKAWAGLSGSTNALQAALDQSFSATMILRSRAAVLQAYDENYRELNNAATANAKVERIIVMAASCAMAPANAELNSLKSAINAPTSASSVSQK